jgi:hypothetical protein
MQSRDPYIKPSLLRLDFTTDVEVVSFSGCKTSGSSTGGRQFIATGGCEQPQCQSAGS